MISLEELIKWGGAIAAAVTAATPFVLFFLYRSDYIRAGHPEPTLLAFRLTASTLGNWARFRRGEKRPVTKHARRDDETPHVHRRKSDPVDFGTVNRPVVGLDEIKELSRRRKTPTRRTTDDASND